MISLPSGIALSVFGDSSFQLPVSYYADVVRNREFGATESKWKKYFLGEDTAAPRPHLKSVYSNGGREVLVLQDSGVVPSGEAVPAIIYIHGGGFVYGSPGRFHLFFSSRIKSVCVLSFNNIIW